MASSSNSPPTSPWDVFLSFRGSDTRNTFTDHLYKALLRTGIHGTEAIQGIISGYYDYYFGNRMNSVTFVAESFKRMSKLKFLYLNNVNLTGSFEQTFEDLRWLRWAFFPLECLPSEFYAEKLVILELPGSNLRTSWKVPQEFKKLKTLNMFGSKELKTTPDFIRLPCLETLNFEDCSSLEEVHVSIGSLASLVHLNLSNCENLRSLPDSICSLRALEVLFVNGCTRLEALPTELGSIESLKTLYAFHRSVSKLPDSIGRLSNLVELNLCYNVNLESLPDSICNLRSLETLDIKDCEELEELPDQLGMITSLKKLNLKGDIMLRMLPDISQLSNIKELHLRASIYLLSISELPTNLKRLRAKDCSSLKRLDLSGLKHLESLDLTNCKALKEIQGLEEVTSLEHLTLSNCRSMERLPNLCNLKHLKRLYLSFCYSLTEIQGLEELTSLEYLNLRNCWSIERLPNLSNLKKDAMLRMLPDISQFSNIKDLDLKGCYHLLSISELPPNLKWLRAKDCTSLKRLLGLSGSKHLKSLDLTNCKALKEIQGLEEVTSLEHLTLSNCRSMERLPNLCNLKHLKRLYLSFCYSLTEIQGLEEVTSLEDLKLSNCSSMKRLPNLCNLKKLGRLRGTIRTYGISVRPDEDVRSLSGGVCNTPVPHRVDLGLLFSL